MIQLCQEYTSLSPDDIEALLHSAQQLEKNPHYEEIDVFIDVYNEMKKEALAHALLGSYLYKNRLYKGSEEK